MDTIGGQPRTVTATAYYYDGLSDEAKKTAIEKSRNCCVEYYDWWDYVYSWYKDEILPSEGFEVSKRGNGNDDAMYFSGFWSQGDGASFEAAVNVHKFMKAHKLCNEFRSLAHWAREGYAWATITQSGRYYHANTMSIKIEFENYAIENVQSADRAEAQLDELESLILSRARELANKLYRDLEKDYWAMTKDGYVAEHIQINEYLFWSNGEPAHFA